jgi:hypothetical protein
MIPSIRLPDSDILLNELLKLDTELKPHYPNSKMRELSETMINLNAKLQTSGLNGKMRDIAALRDVNSVFLATNIFPLSGKMLENPIRHDAIKLLEPAAKLLGRTSDDIHYAYYATIPPMSQIYPHVDIAPYYSKVNRYQIFFDLTEDQTVIQHGSNATSNSIVWFDPSITHAFINKSPTDAWRFVVFDIYK